jgi:2'-5' RNA ligase
MTDAGHRIFIAVPLDAALRRAVEAVERQMEAAGARLRWITSENLHFTLRFLGHISEAELVRARRAAREAVEGTGPFRIRLAGVGAFPSARRPQVVWVGVTEGEEQLRDLARRLDDMLARERFPKEPRVFQAHLTLARIRDSRPAMSLEAVIASLAGVEVGGQAVESITVMESRLRPSGALYIPVEEVPLSSHEK